MLEERLSERREPPTEAILAWGRHLGRREEKEQ